MALSLVLLLLLALARRPPSPHIYLSLPRAA
jgi:hypothetical protein